MIFLLIFIVSPNVFEFASGIGHRAKSRGFEHHAFCSMRSAL